MNSLRLNPQPVERITFLYPGVYGVYPRKEMAATVLYDSGTRLVVQPDECNLPRPLEYGEVRSMWYMGIGRVDARWAYNRYNGYRMELEKEVAQEKRDLSMMADYFNSKPVASPFLRTLEARLEAVKKHTARTYALLTLEQKVVLRYEQERARQSGMQIPMTRWNEELLRMQD